MTKEELYAIILPYLDEDMKDIENDEDLTDAGLDSIALMTITEDLRSQQIMVTFMELAEEPTMEAWLRIIHKKIMVQ